MSRYISKKIKLNILTKQDYKCANSTHTPSTNLKDYHCLLWKYSNGEFDEAGYEFDHIDEFAKTGDNNILNIQALCPNCHAVKTKRFLKNKKTFTSKEMDNGYCLMEIDNKKIRKKRKLSVQQNK